MRIALLFSGQPRCVDGISYESIKRCLLDRYTVDVYAHFWGDLETAKSSGSMDANLERFKELYSPKAMRVDPPLQPDEFPLSFLQRYSPVPLTRDMILTLEASSNWAYWIRNCVSMYTSMGRVYELFKTAGGGQYDWIIRTRTDCVFLRCPMLESLERNRLYAPQWHGVRQEVVVNHALIVSPSLAPALFSIRSTLERLPGKMDESFVFHHLKSQGVLSSVRTLPMRIFYPTLTRDGCQTDKPEPGLTSEVVAPPYSAFSWGETVMGTSAWKKIQLG